MLILQFKFWKVQGEGKGGGGHERVQYWKSTIHTFFERVQYIPIFVPRTPNSVLCIRYKLHEWQKLFTQMQSNLHTTLKMWGGVLVSEFLWLIVSKEIHQSLFMTVLIIDCMRKCFLIKFYEILWKKVFKMKMKVTEISGAKINHFFNF